MTPIYASNRIDLSGWYAFQEPAGMLALWDGGVNRETVDSKLGIWCPMNGVPIYRDPEFLDRLPNIPMYGWVDDEGFTAMDFPHVDDALNLTGRLTDNQVFYLTQNDGSPLPFFAATMRADMVFSSVENCNARFVGCRILPENKDESLRLAREMGPDTLVRHPLSRWSRQRNPFYASLGGPRPTQGRVREVKISEGYVVEVSCWTTPQTIATLYPLYEGDQYPDREAFVPTAPINLYMTQGIVVGYD